MVALVFDAPIVGGTPAPAGAWPDAVAVIGRAGTCSGTLIAPDVVLTAGHCLEIEPDRIVASTVDYERGGLAVAVGSAIAYPDAATTYDVSVLRLAAPVPGVTPRAIGTACTFDGFERGSHVELVGFGLTDDDAAGANSVLHEADVGVTDPDCTDGNGCRPAISPGGEFVAGGAGVDSCNGDSGGPVYFTTPRGDVAVGVVSRGVADSVVACGDGGIYVRTDKIARWLVATVGPVAMDSCTGSAADATASPAPASAGCQVSSRHAALVVAVVLLRIRPRSKRRA